MSGLTRLTDSKTESQLCIVNVATVHNDEFSNNKSLDICSSRADSPLILSSSDIGLFQNEFNSTALNVRSPPSMCKNEISDNLESSDSNVQTSVIPSLIVPDTKFAQNVSNINSSKIMYPNIADESKYLSKRCKIDSFSDVFKIPLNPLYVFVKFYFLFGFFLHFIFLHFILGAGLFGGIRSSQSETKYDTWEPLGTEFAPFNSLFLNFLTNYKLGHQFFKHHYKDEFSLSVFDSREGNFFRLRVQ